MKRSLFLFFVVAAIAIMAGGQALAQSATVRGDVTVTEGTMSLTRTSLDSFSFGSIDLNTWFITPTTYENMTNDNDVVFEVVNTLAANSGWKLTLEASAFTNGMHIDSLTLDSGWGTVVKSSVLGDDPATFTLADGLLNDKDTPGSVKAVSAPIGGTYKGRGRYTVTILAGKIVLDAYDAAAPGVPPVSTNSTTITATLANGP
jgi:hypothetical protein